jgi:hypothetical protein
MRPEFIFPTVIDGFAVCVFVPSVPETVKEVVAAAWFAGKLRVRVFDPVPAIVVGLYAPVIPLARPLVEYVTVPEYPPKAVWFTANVGCCVPVIVGQKV